MATERRGAAAEIEGPRIVLLLTTLALVLIGFVMIYSASSVSALTENTSAASYLLDQVKFAVLGLIAAVIVVRFFPYESWFGGVLWVYWGICMVMLLLTAVAGTSALGAQRWLVLGPISLQPSEFAKIAIVIMMAKLLGEMRMGGIDQRSFFIQLLLTVVAPTGFLFLTQSDLGTTVIIALGIIAALYLGEVPMKWIVGIIAFCIVFAVFATVLSSYRSNRWLFLNPWNDGKNGNGLGYQLVHSYYAFSEGGLFGSGLGNSREKFLYLPESETDFIFSIIGEELGMAGALLVIALFLAFLWAGMRIARYAPDVFGTEVAGALSAMIVAQAFLNIGCVIGVLPTTGKPLPFISSGGSSLIATFIMVALIYSVAGSSESPRVYRRRRDDLRVVRAEGGARRAAGTDASPYDGGSRNEGRRAGGGFGARPARSPERRGYERGALGGSQQGSSKRSSLVDGFPSGRSDDSRWR